MAKTFQSFVVSIFGPQKTVPALEPSSGSRPHRRDQQGHDVAPVHALRQQIGVAAGHVDHLAGGEVGGETGIVGGLQVNHAQCTHARKRRG